MRVSRPWLMVFLMMLLPLSAMAAPEQWLFAVRLDDKPIGQHVFTRTGDGDSYTMDVRADFKATLFLVVPFRYEHRNKEVWKGGCLQSIESGTDDNGDNFKVSGSISGDSFTVTSNGKKETLPRCVSTFAYWDKQLLGQTALLNSQDGRYTPTKVEDKGIETIRAFGKDTQATRYKLTAGDLTIYLWYSKEGHWLRLESPVKGGMTLKYERISP